MRRSYASAQRRTRWQRTLCTVPRVVVFIATVAFSLDLDLTFLPLRLITFDLDDTLWPQDTVIARANEVMTSELMKAGASSFGAEEVAREMRAIRHNRTQLARDRGEPPFKISYSDLRNEGIAAVLQQAGLSQAAAKCAADSIFERWLTARHKAAGDLLFDGAVASLLQLRQDYPRLVVGAVTNSRADPFAVRSLRPLFDFCVSGEDADVFPHRKPSPVIFELAIERARAASVALREEDNTGCEYGWWVHVGDDLPNDVRASALLGAAPIWVTGANRSVTGVGQTRPSYSTATAEEVEERDQAAAEARKLVAGEISTVAELPALLQRWRQHGLSSALRTSRAVAD